MSDTSKFSFPNIDLTAGIVAAYVAHNHVRPSELRDLIASIFVAVGGLQRSPMPEAAETTPEPPTAAQIRKSVTPDGLISFLDGKPYKTLKRHLTNHGLTPEGYRARYGLPADYPMTAPNYSARRAELARAIGLGSLGGRARRAA